MSAPGADGRSEADAGPQIAGWGGVAHGDVAPASVTVPMPAGPARPGMLLLDPPPGTGAPPSEADLAPVRDAFREECRDLLRLSRGHFGARMVASILEEAAAAEKDPNLRWVLLEETLRLGIVSGEPKRIESAVALAAEHYRFDALRTEIDAVADIPQRALRPQRLREIALAAERLAAVAADRPRERDAAWKLAADTWRRAGEPLRVAAALEAARRSRTSRAGGD